MVVFGTASGLEAVNAGTGERLWTVPLDGRVDSVGVVDDVAIADVRDGPLVAVDGLEGEPRWRTGDDDGTTRPPVIAAGTVYVGGERPVVLDAATGSVRWTGATPDGTSALGPLAVGRGRVFGVGTVDLDLAVVAAYDAGSGELLWAERLQRDASVEVGAPVVVGERLYVALGDLRAFDADDGEQLWARDVATSSGATPAVAGGRCVLREDGTRVTARDLTDGDPLWTRDLDAELATPPVVGTGAVYVVDETGSLHALGAPEGTSPTVIDDPTPDERTGGYDWVDSWAPTAGVLGAPHVVAPLVLGGLVALANRLDGAGDDDAD